MKLSAPTLRERCARALSELLADETRNASVTYTEYLRHVVDAADDDGRVGEPLSVIAARTVTGPPIRRKLVGMIRRDGIVRTDDEGAVYLTEPESWPVDMRPRGLPVTWTDKSTR